MANSERFTMPSGATLDVTPASFAEASRLRNTVLKAMQGLDLTGKDLGTTVEDLKKGKGLEVLGKVFDKVLTMATSEEVEAALFACGARAVYTPAGSEAGAKMTRALFDEPAIAEAARGDYYVMAARVIEVNCKPFFKALFSGSKALAAAGPGARA